MLEAVKVGGVFVEGLRSARGTGLRLSRWSRPEGTAAGRVSIPRGVYVCFYRWCTKEMGVRAGGKDVFRSACEDGCVECICGIE